MHGLCVCVCVCVCESTKRVYTKRGKENVKNFYPYLCVACCSRLHLSTTTISSHSDTDHRLRGEHSGKDGGFGISVVSFKKVRCALLSGTRNKIRIAILEYGHVHGEFL